MATITIRNIPDDLVERIKSVANSKGRSMEQELRELLKTRYASRSHILIRARQRWEKLPPVTSEEIDGWKEEGRP